MADDKRDLLDDLIDIQADWQKLSNPLGDIASDLTDAASGTRKVFNPADYKERPRANSSRCVRCAGVEPTKGSCSLCADVCPTKSIAFTEKAMSLDDRCRKCGLCVAVCPTEAITGVANTQRRIYDRVATAASAYDEAYITCTRAIKRLPQPNEIVLPCVGAVSRDLWFALLTDYTNVSVYLPLGICDKCRTTTGEQAYSDAIATAEEWSQGAVGLEVDAKALRHEQSRAYKRSQFMSSAITSAERLVSRSSPALAGAQAVAKKIQDHSRLLDRLTRSIENAVGAKTTNNRQRILTNKRKLMMSALQHDPGLAAYVHLDVPVVDSDRCTVCGDCAKVCTVHALDITDQGRVRVEADYCVNCGACVAACHDGALSMAPCDVKELVVPDEMTAEVRKRKAEAKAEADKLVEKGKAQLKKTGDALEKLDK